MGFMQQDEEAENGQTKVLEEVLGYLNFSSGAPDPRFLANLNRLWSELAAAAAPRRRRKTKKAVGEEPPTWQKLGERLQAALESRAGTTDAFRSIEQAQAVLRLVFAHALPAYRRHHRDLLFHQTEASLFQPFFIGRVCEAVLRQGAPWQETERIVDAALAALNDYIGHRPVAVLQTQKLQPYAHEWVRPIPLYVRGAGVAAGPYHEVVAQALEILAYTDPTLLARAWFNLEWLDELAVDPRAYDFDHPVNKRPNYHFGQWDPHHIDNAGRYRRFVVQQVTLDALMTRVTDSRHPRDEVLFEAGAVLAGTMLMASGVSGSGPQLHDSSVTLATLLPHIAHYRDEFYQQLIKHVEGVHATRLRKEAVTLRQPFGGARQHLNQELARRRALQLQHTRLAQLFAWMGYTDAAAVQAEVVPVASARMSCQIYCLLTAGHLAGDRGQREAAEAALPKAEDLLQRAIQCGALADPWNILGFGGQFSLFPAVENSVHDHRVDELIELVSQVFGLFTRLMKEAAAAGDATMCGRLAAGMERLAKWWDRFASIEVSDVEGFSGRQAWESAVHVADVLREWHAAGTAAGDVAFWRSRLERFTSAKSYALVVESLLEQRDPVAAMALLIQWLSQANTIALEEQDYSFHQLATAWMENLLDSGADHGHDERTLDPAQRWPLARKLLDFIEANAEQYWEVPTLELAEASRRAGAAEEPAEDEAIDPLFAAAYEDVTFHDSAADGFEGEMLQGGGNATDYELAMEADRLADRLAFLITVARLWKMVASTLGVCAEGAADRDAVLSGWLERATANRQRLAELMTAVDRYPIPAPRGNQESLVEYDRRRAVKEQLLEQIMATCVETADAARSIRAALGELVPEAQPASWEEPAQRVFHAVFRGDRAGIRASWRELITALGKEPLLYVALARGGSPQKIVASRNVQRVLRRLLAYLPRLGMLEETFGLIRVIQGMEQDHAVGPGAITEFDQMFEIGCRGIVRSLTISSEQWARKPRRVDEEAADMELISCLERAVEALLQCWLDHSRRVRLSVMETVSDEPQWRTLRRFVETYGEHLFTQKFMTLGNLRAILHQGVDRWLAALQEEPDNEEGELRLLADLDGALKREEAVRWLSVAIEAVVENYSEYVDYNSTTTQSDRGEMLYTLLDFLRLQASYNRVAWNLRPVIVAHEVLVRCGRDRAAEIWRQAVIQRTRAIADDHQRRFAKLSRQYGMHLPSIAERLGERFVRPLEIARLQALVEPAIEELREGEETISFSEFQDGVTPLVEEPSGVGFEVPQWLEALEHEVEEIRLGTDEDREPLDPLLPVAEVFLTPEEVKRQLRRIADTGSVGEPPPPP
jgi:hypothetical protein